MAEDDYGKVDQFSPIYDLKGLKCEISNRSPLSTR